MEVLHVVVVVVVVAKGEEGERAPILGKVEKAVP